MFNMWNYVKSWVWSVKSEKKAVKYPTPPKPAGKKPKKRR